MFCFVEKETAKKVSERWTRYIQVVGKTPNVLTSGEKEERAY